MAYNIKQINKFSDEVLNADVDENGYITLEIPNIVKFGYICEDKGIGLPIFLKIDGKYQKFEIGKTGMYEASDIDVDGIKIPIGNDKDFNFTFDYVIYNAE